MGWFKASAMQHRFWSKLRGTIDESMILDHHGLKKILPEAHIKEGSYMCPDNGKVSQILSKQSHCNPYMGTRFLSHKDCCWFSEKSAILMRGFAFGIMDCQLYEQKEGQYHRMNCFINRKGEFWAFEPQLCTYPGNRVKRQGAIYIGHGWENPYDNIDEEMAKQMKVPNRG